MSTGLTAIGNRADLRPQRLYVIPATHAPTALVIARKRGWWILGRWDLDAPTFTEGASFKGKLYPRRCDLASLAPKAHAAPAWAQTYGAKRS